MSDKIVITLNVNGEDQDVMVAANQTLLEVLRDQMHLTGAKKGCNQGVCGACTVLLDGLPVRSCLVLAQEVDGAEVLTIEGLARDGVLTPLQDAFIETGAVQCGYCAPGFLLAAHALLERHPSPTREQILDAYGGHLCRCTGYEALFQAVELASRRGTESAAGSG